MIYPDDAKDFSSMMDTTWQSVGRNTVDKATKQFWFGKLQHLALGDVANAFDKYIMSGRDKPPQLTDILHAVKPVEFYKALPSHHDPEIRSAGDHVNTERNYKAWADKIVANPDRYSYTAVRYAKEALRV